MVKFKIISFAPAFKRRQRGKKKVEKRLKKVWWLNLKLFHLHPLLKQDRRKRKSDKKD